MSPSVRLNLEQQKKQARELLRAARDGDIAALARFRAHHPRLTESSRPAASLALHDAQLVIAREHGFPSWPKFKAHLERGTKDHTRVSEDDVQYHEDRAGGLLEVLGDGATATIEQVRDWHPRFAGASDDAIRTAVEAGSFGIEDARLVYAREHGFEDWAGFAEHLRRLRAGAAREPFIEVMKAGKRLDWPRVTIILREHPDLVRARGTNGNTLLNIAAGMVCCSASNPAGGDTTRLEPLRLLLAAGADPNQGNDRGWTPLHQAGYGNDPALASLLIDAGARVDPEAHGAGGTPLAVALFWGNREAADALADYGVTPANLRIAGGLGRPDLIASCFTATGELTAEARAGRGFYRPHSGFPRWRPADDPQEVLDEALVWAAKAEHMAAMDLLLERGARIDVDPYRGTPLIWAAANGRTGAVRWLLEHGADVNRRATFGGPSHGEGVTALHLAAQDDAREVAEILVAHGADLAIEDAIYHSTPLGWATHFGSRRVRQLLEERHPRPR